MANHPSPPEAAAFGEQIRQITPRLWVTPLIIAANVGMFVLQIVGGAHLLTPTTDALLAQGANYGPMTTGGQWWRLATSTFVHIGIIHLLMNMAVLAQIGTLVERLLGNLGFLLLYLTTGILASLTSLAWNPGVVSAGASGAVFGCYGIFIGLLLRNREAIPPAVRQQLFKGAGAFLLYNVLFGATMANIDQAAHVGGLVAGFLAGLAVALPLNPQARRLARALLVTGLAAGLGVAAAFALPTAFDWRGEINQVIALEQRINTVLTDAQKRLMAGELDDPGYAALLRKDVLPDWQAGRDRLASGTHLPDGVREKYTVLIQYMDERGRGWRLLAEAAETQDMKKMEEAQKAFEAAKKLGETK